MLAFGQPFVELPMRMQPVSHCRVKNLKRMSIKKLLHDAWASILTMKKRDKSTNSADIDKMNLEKQLEIYYYDHKYSFWRRKCIIFAVHLIIYDFCNHMLIHFLFSFKRNSKVPYILIATYHF